MNELYLIVSLAGERVAFRAADVQSVIELDSITPAPRAPGWVAGLAALRSRALTVIDCLHSLELERAEGEEPSRKAAVVEHEDSVPAELGRGWQRVARGMVETELGVMLVVDIAELIAGPHTQKAA